VKPLSACGLLAAGALLLGTPACGYRWVMPGGPSALGLLPVINATAEPRLGPWIADAVFREGGVHAGGGERGLEVAATAFREEPALLVAGVPRRQRMTLEVEWRVLPGGAGTPAPGAALGRGRQTVTREYPLDGDFAASAPAVDWARTSSLRLLVRDAVREVLDRAEDVR
jgi:hypothetical protein